MKKRRSIAQGRAAAMKKAVAKTRKVSSPLRKRTHSRIK